MCVAGPEPEQRRRVHPGIHASQHGELHPRLDDPGVHAEVMEPRIQDHLVDGVHCQKEIAIPLRVTQAASASKGQAMARALPS